MYFKRILLASLLVVFSISLGSLIQARQEEPEEAKQEQERIVIPSGGEDSVARRDFMRTKMMYTQNVFRGLIAQDFEIILEAVEEIEMITEGAQWVAVDDARYQALTRDFTRSTQRLREAAESGNIDATALRYYDLSTRCIDCHRRLVRAGDGL